MNTSHFQFQKGFPKEAWIVIHTAEVVPVFTSGRISITTLSLSIIKERCHWHVLAHSQLIS